MAEWTESQIQTTLAEVTKRATTDMEYRKLALSDPAAAIAKIDPTPIPAGFKLRFVENAGANLTVVLPDPVSEGELSDAELEQVAGGGGRCGGSCAASCVISSIV
jgi:hypothetical protein